MTNMLVGDAFPAWEAAKGKAHRDAVYEVKPALTMFALFKEGIQSGSRVSDILNARSNRNFMALELHDLFKRLDDFRAFLKNQVIEGGCTHSVAAEYPRRIRSFCDDLRDLKLVSFGASSAGPGASTLFSTTLTPAWQAIVDNAKMKGMVHQDVSYLGTLAILAQSVGVGPNDAGYGNSGEILFELCTKYQQQRRRRGLYPGELYTRLQAAASRAVRKGVLTPIAIPPSRMRPRNTLDYSELPMSLASEIRSYDRFTQQNFTGVLSIPGAQLTPRVIKVTTCGRRQDQLRRLCYYASKVAKMELNGLALKDLFTEPVLAGYLAWRLDSLGVPGKPGSCNGKMVEVKHPTTTIIQETIEFHNLAKNFLGLDGVVTQKLKNVSKSWRSAPVRDKFRRTVSRDQVLYVADYMHQRWTSGLRTLLKSVGLSKSWVAPWGMDVGLARKLYELGDPVRDRLKKICVTVGREFLYRWHLARPLRGSSFANARLGDQLVLGADGIWVMQYDSYELKALPKRFDEYVAEFPGDLVGIMTFYVNVARSVLLDFGQGSMKKSHEGCENNECSHVFVNLNGNPYKLQNMSDAFSKWIYKVLGVSTYMHLVRHTSADFYHDKTKSVRETAALLGNSPGVVEQYYLKRDPREAARRFDLLRQEDAAQVGIPALEESIRKVEEDIGRLLLSSKRLSKAELVRTGQHLEKLKALHTRLGGNRRPRLLEPLESSSKPGTKRKIAKGDGSEVGSKNSGKKAGGR